jgi:NAD(P)-dependent dehydrogenase (short-subunit alcohol dehydrogenase family)
VHLSGDGVTLAGTRVVVIGGSGGMGLATAKAAAAGGAEVVIASRSDDRLEQACREIRGEVIGKPLDVSREDEVERFFDEVGELDHLVTTFTQRSVGLVVERDTASARAAFDTKFWGSFYAAKYAAPRIRPGGSITLFSGIAAFMPTWGGSVTAAINGAIVSLVQVLAVELAPIRVNAVSPGLIVRSGTEWELAIDRSSYYERAQAVLPVRRLGQASDAAETALYLMRSRFTTGSVVHLDGGGRFISALHTGPGEVGSGSPPMRPASAT